MTGNKIIGIVMCSLSFAITGVLSAIIGSVFKLTVLKIIGLILSSIGICGLMLLLLYWGIILILDK